MAEISEAAKLKACELHHDLASSRAERIQPRIPQVDEITWDDTIPSPIVTLALFIQQVSDAAKGAIGYGLDWEAKRTALTPFVLPEPADPVEEALAEARLATSCGPMLGAERLKEQLAKRGLQIVPVQS